MKKVYLSILSFAAISLGIAQENSKMHEFKTTQKKGNIAHSKVPVVIGTKKQSNNNEKSITPIWSENFTPTGALTTSNGVWTAGGSNASYWSFATTHPWSANGWTEALDGSFLKWDSYTPNSNETDFASTSVDGEFISPNIDLSSVVNGAVLSFKTESMYCCNANELPYSIAVSEDGGATWSTPITIDLGVDRNVATEDIEKPMTVSVDLSSLTTGATNQTKIKFIWTGINADQNGQKNTHYWWLIDDVKLYDKLNNDLSVEKIWLNDITTGYEHTEIPKSFAGPLTVQAKIKNHGKLTPTNIQANVKLLSSTGTELASSTGGVLTNNFSGTDTDTITFTTNIDLSSAPYTIGSYRVKVEVVSASTDENTENDTISRLMKITDYYLGQQIFEQSTSIESVGQDDISGATASSPMTFGNVMTIPSSLTTVDLHGLEIKYAKNNSYPVTTGEIEVKIYEYDPQASDFQSAFVDLYISRFFLLSSGDLPSSNNSIKTKLLNFHATAGGDSGPVTLEGGKSYIVAVYHPGGNQHFTYLTNVNDDDYSSVIYGPFSSSTSDDRWFVNGKQILTRMCFNETLNVNEVNADKIKFSVHPNPTSGNVNVNYTLENNADVVVSVVDVAGKELYSSIEADKAAGKYNTNVETSSFNSGVYYVTVSVNGVKSTTKLIKK